MYMKGSVLSFSVHTCSGVVATTDDVAWTLNIEIIGCSKSMHISCEVLHTNPVNNNLCFILTSETQFFLCTLLVGFLTVPHFFLICFFPIL